MAGGRLRQEAGHRRGLLEHVGSVVGLVASWIRPDRICSRFGTWWRLIPAGRTFRVLVRVLQWAGANRNIGSSNRSRRISIGFAVGCVCIRFAGGCIRFTGGFGLISRRNCRRLLAGRCTWRLRIDYSAIRLQAFWIDWFNDFDGLWSLDSLLLDRNARFEAHLNLEHVIRDSQFAAELAEVLKVLVERILDGVNGSRHLLRVIFAEVRPHFACVLIDEFSPECLGRSSCSWHFTRTPFARTKQSFSWQVR